MTGLINADTGSLDYSPYSTLILNSRCLVFKVFITRGDGLVCYLAITGHFPYCMMICRANLLRSPVLGQSP